MHCAIPFSYSYLLFIDNNTLPTLFIMHCLYLYTLCIYNSIPISYLFILYLFIFWLINFLITIVYCYIKLSFGCCGAHIFPFAGLMKEFWFWSSHTEQAVGLWAIPDETVVLTLEEAPARSRHFLSNSERSRSHYKCISETSVLTEKLWVIDWLLLIRHSGIFLVPL